MREKITRRSNKRDAIYAELKASKAHPSAETIFTALKSAHPDLSLGTVYRNLSIFKEEGKIVTVGVVDGKERYDADTAPHNHFICRSCGAVADVKQPITLSFGGGVLELDGNHPESVDIVFHGLCKQCASLGDN